MSKHLKLNSIKGPKASSCYSRSEIQKHKKKGRIIGYFGLSKAGRPPKAQDYQTPYKTNTSDVNQKNNRQKNAPLVYSRAVLFRAKQ